MKSHLKNLIQKIGPLSVSQFMNEALFHPQLGYYKQQNPFGKKGDFITAPEISQIFGELIGAYLVNIWQNNYSKQKINLVEMGAGKGTLMKDLLNFAQKIPDFLDQFDISIVEISPKLQEIQKQNLQEFDIKWFKNFSDFYQENQNQPIFFIANELFDCFAINQLVKTKDGWMERRIATNNDKLQFVLSPPIITDEELENKFAIEAIATTKINDFFEYSPTANNFMDELSKIIKETGGMAIIIDYGYVNNQFKNSLQAVRNHQYCDILKEVGNCDITSLVDFNNLQNIAQKNDLQTSLISQREFLQAIGIEIRRKQLLTGKNSNEQENINSAINRLIDKDQMGELFKFLIIW